MGRAEKRELVTRLAVLPLHLLKWKLQPAKRGASWEASIRVQRNRLADHLDDNPSLRPLLAKALSAAYRDAVLETIAETGLPEATFAQVCLGPLSRRWTPNFGQSDGRATRSVSPHPFLLAILATSRTISSVHASRSPSASKSRITTTRMSGRTLASPHEKSIKSIAPYLALV